MTRLIARLAALLSISLALAVPLQAHADGTATPTASPSPTASPTPSPTPVLAPLAPTSLWMARPGTSGALGTGRWVNVTTVALHFHAAAGLIPQVEVQPAGRPFTGKQTASGGAIPAEGLASVDATRLRNGTYHWQARVTSAAGVASPWVQFSSPTQAAFGVDLTPPGRPVITSSTNPNQKAWYRVPVVRMNWHATDALSGVAAYAFTVRHRSVLPIGRGVAKTNVAFPHLKDGRWVVTVRARDNAGNWSRASIYRFNLDRTPAQVTWLSGTGIQFNPYENTDHMEFRVSEPATVRLSLYRVGSKTRVRTFVFRDTQPGKVLNFAWNGRNAQGHMAPEGYYFFSAHTVDRAGNVTHLSLGGIDFTPIRPSIGAGGVRLFPGQKLIVVVLSQEALYAYDGQHLALHTLVTTGDRLLPTPVGVYHVMARFHPYEFISPWPPGSPFWYAPSWVEYALLFRDGGYFLHDAPWRSVFGPGSNAGTAPGTNYGGTHGCVNIPPDAMLFLWNWTPVGTQVDVVP